MGCILFVSPSISTHSLAPTPSAAERGCAHGCGRQIGAENCADGCGREMGAENCAADLQRLLLPTHFQPLPRTLAVRNRPRNSPHPFPVRNRPRSQARSSPATSSPTHFQPIPCTRAVRSHPRNSPGHLPSAAVPRSHARSFPQRLLLPNHFQPAVVCAILSTHFPSAAVRAAKLAHHQRHLIHPFPRPQPSAQPSSLISSGFFSPPIPATPWHPHRPHPLYDMGGSYSPFYRNKLRVLTPSFI